MTRKSVHRPLERDDQGTLQSVGRAAQAAARFERAGDLIATLRGDGLLLHLSPGWATILGVTTASMCGHFLNELPTHNSTAKDLFEKLHQALARTGCRTESEAVHLQYPGEEGQLRTLEGQIYPRDSASNEIFAIFRDITVQWNQLGNIAANEKRFRIVAEAGRNMVTETDEDGIFRYVSSGCLEVLGYRPSELIGTSPLRLNHREEIDEFRDQVLRDTTIGRPFLIKPHRLKHKNGSWVWVEAVGVRDLGADGKVRILGVARDIDQQIHAEESRRELEDRVLRSQKLESLGVLAGGVAHDFNNFLTPIVGNAGLLLLDLPKGSPLRKRAEMIRTAADRATDLTRQMLAYAGHGVPGDIAVDVSEEIKDMSLLIEATASHAARLHYDLEEHLPLIQVDNAHVGQVVMNLVANASDSLPTSGGQIEIRTGSMYADRAMLDACFVGSDMEKGLVVFVEVCDDGAGITQENLPRIFDPFFTTRFEGRGLGLAAVHGIIRGYHGAIDLISKPGHGTRIRVLFPAISQDPPEVDRVAKKPKPDVNSLNLRESYTALVVDDDEGSRDLISSTLSRVGIRILEATDGAEAIQLFERWGPEIGVVLLDCTMPGFSGDRVFEALRRIRSDVRIILVSGYSRERVADALLKRGAAAFLQKPFEPEKLILEIRKLAELKAR